MNQQAIKKNYIRSRIKHQRSTLTTPFQERSAIALLGHASNAQLIEDHKTIAFYLPIKGEISCWPLIDYALSLGKKCYIPKVFPNKKRGMWFLPYDGKESVAKGAYGILEPTSPIHKAIRPSDLEIVFMPLVAFDPKGNRLGMGGGYYDTVFSSLANKSTTQLVGLGYNFQQMQQLPTESWDLSLNSVITPSYFRRFD